MRRDNLSVLPIYVMSSFNICISLFSTILFYENLFFCEKQQYFLNAIVFKYLKIRNFLIPFFMKIFEGKDLLKKISLTLLH